MDVHGGADRLRLRGGRRRWRGCRVLGRTSRGRRSRRRRLSRRWHRRSPSSRRRLARSTMTLARGAR
eukprot:13424314-Alexandrium_andersonii.AAC.1